jgi:FkbM family methyltransferase
MNKIINYNNLNILDGINTHPGSGNIYQHTYEINLFHSILEEIENKKNPVMIEVGCFWALWSLLFRKKFKDGKNILIELGKRQLEVGKYNFKLNEFDYSSYHGGFFLNESGTFKNKEADLEYDIRENIELKNFIPSSVETNNVVGPELNFFEIVKSEKLDIIDLLHMDIQGSELQLIFYISSLFESKKILNIVIATHSQYIHKEIENFLLKNEYNIMINYPFGSLGGDGYIFAKNKI